MRFISALLAGALAVVASAQTGSTANPFTNTDYSGIAVGTPVDLTWTPTTSGTVTILLVQGDPGALTTVETVQSGLPNTGAYTWTPDSSIVNGQYALKIVDDTNPDNYNFTPIFPISSPLTASATPSSTAPSSSSSAPATTTSDSSSSDSTTAASSSTGSSSSSASTTMATTTSSSAPSKTSSPSSSSSGAAATGGAKVGAGLVGFIGAAMLLL